jgi:DNA polymerase-3 subunit delta'
LLLLVTHVPGRVLPTIRSRCRVLTLRPLGVEDVARAAVTALGEAKDTPEIRAAAEASEGSVGRALTLLEGGVLELRRQVLTLLEKLPGIEGRALHRLGDAMSGVQTETLAAFMDTVNAWLSERLHSAPQESGRLAKVANAWENVNRAAQEVEEYNLDRKPFVFSVFNVLAEAARP